MGTGTGSAKSLVRTDGAEGTALVARVARRALAGRTEEALALLCAAACQAGRATAAGVFVFAGHQIQSPALARLGPLRHRALLFDLRPRSALRRRLRHSAGPVELGEHRLLALRVDGRCAGALYVEFPDQASEVTQQLEALAALAAAVLERGGAQRAAALERWGQRREHAQVKARLARLEAAQRRLGHDLKTPLVALKGYVDMMLRGMGGPVSATQQRYLLRMAQAVERQRALIDEALWSPRQAQAVGCDAVAVASEVASALRRSGRRVGVWMDVDGPATAPCAAGRAELTLLVRELLLGALEVAPTRSRLDLRVEAGEAGPVLLLAVEELPSANARLRRCAALARRLGGALTLGTREAGAVISVTLSTPAQREPAAGAPEAAAAH